MSGTSFCFESLGADASPVIADVHGQLLLVVVYAHLDLSRLGVVEGVAQRFPSYPVDFVSQDRLQFPRRPFPSTCKAGGLWLAPTVASSAPSV